MELGAPKLLDIQMPLGHGELGMELGVHGPAMRLGPGVLQIPLEVPEELNGGGHRLRTSPGLVEWGTVTELSGGEFRRAEEHSTRLLTLGTAL